MRPLTDRELFLQNLVATSATLVFRCAKAMESGSPVAREALVIECEEWFQETKRSLQTQLEKTDAVLRGEPEKPEVQERPVLAPWQAPPVKTNYFRD